jgi:hypothetical protein
VRNRGDGAGMRAVASILALGALVACGQDKIGVAHGEVADYNHKALLAAVEKFVAAGRTPQAYAELAATVTKLRPGMDKSVGEEAELKMVVLALAPMKAMADKPMAEQVETLALTVWPTLLAPPIEADALMRIRDPKAAQLAPLANEGAHDYIQRICGTVLAGECKQAVPELQGNIVDQLVVHRATERVRNAVNDCLMCTSEPGWKEAVAGWEELDGQAERWVADITRRADPAMWPVSGNAADDDPWLPEAEFTRQGDLVLDGHKYGPNQQRIDVLRELRGTDTLIALHIHPDTTLEQTRAILVDARKAGCTKVAVIAREQVYPWRRKVYWIADGTGLRANLRPSDSLQLLLHAVDEVAGPGTIARVD